MGGNGVTQSVLFNPALVALYTDKVLHLEYFNRYGVKELGTVGIGFVYPNPLLSAGVDISFSVIGRETAEWPVEDRHWFPI